MLTDVQNFTGYEFEQRQSHLVNRSYCDWSKVPDAVDYIDSLGSFGIGLIVVGSTLTILTFYLVVDTVCRISSQDETNKYKTNSLLVLSIYPIASICSLLAVTVPRSQLLSESLTQICLAISLYRLFLLLIDLGHRSVSKPPSMVLKVGPCCCWPCLPFPDLQMNRNNLTWLRLCVLQFTIIQGFTYCVMLFLNTEDTVLAHIYGPYLQPVALTSLLFGLYGLTVATKSLHESAPDAALPRRTMVSQMVLLFSKLQGFVIKSLPAAGVFPCYPPLTPQIYANMTYNCLMLIEMLMLSWLARNIYVKPELNRDEDGGIIETYVVKNTISNQPEVMGNNELANLQLPVPIGVLTSQEPDDSRTP